MEVLRGAFVEINDFVSWRSRIGKTTCWKHKVDFSFWNNWAKNFSVIPFFTCISCPGNSRSRELWSNISTNMNTYHKYAFLMGFLLFPCIFSFYNSWVLSHIGNPIKSYIFSFLNLCVMAAAEMAFLIKLKRSVPGRAGLLNGSMFEDFLIMCYINSISFNQKTAFGRGDRLSAK